MPRATFIKSSDTRILESFLSEAKIGETITYEQMSQALGRDVRKFAIASLGSARRGVLREKRFVFSTIPNVGMVRLNDSQIVKSTSIDRKSIQKKSKRVLEKLACSDYSKLEETDKKQHTATAAIFGALAMFSSSSSQKKVESKVHNTSQLAIGDTIKMFV